MPIVIFALLHFYSFVASWNRQEPVLFKKIIWDLCICAVFDAPGDIEGERGEHKTVANISVYSMYMFNTLIRDFEWKFIILNKSVLKNIIYLWLFWNDSKLTTWNIIIYQLKHIRWYYKRFLLRLKPCLRKTRIVNQTFDKYVILSSF